MLTTEINIDRNRIHRSTRNKDIDRLLNILDNAVITYKEVTSTKVTSTGNDDEIIKFLNDLAQQHKIFVRETIGRKSLLNKVSATNQLEPDATFKKGSAIDMLLLCIDIEKKILEQAREAVHNSSGHEKLMLCRQLAFSEEAIFEADQMLEEYE